MRNPISAIFPQDWGVSKIRTKTPTIQAVLLPRFVPLILSRILRCVHDCKSIRFLGASTAESRLVPGCGEPVGSRSMLVLVSLARQAYRLGLYRANVMVGY